MSAGTFGSYTTGTVLGRAVGFDLGISGNTSRDLHQQYTISNLGRFVGVTSRIAAGTAQDFVYSYQASSALINGYTAGANFATSRDYETQRDLPTRLEAKWGATSLTRFDFSYNALYQRATASQSGTAFADYTSGLGYTHVFNVYGYNARGEVQTAAMYRGDTATTTPSSGDELPGHRFEYRYDSIGNRVTAGETGAANTGDDEYTANALNQYTGKENNTVRVIGTAASAAHVAVLGAASTGKTDRAWGADLVPANTSSAVQANATTYAALLGAGTGGADLILTNTKPYFVPPAVQTLSYDADGNLTSDGVSTYTYNAENQLVRVASSLPSGFGFTRLRLDFKYDYAGRRVEKTVYNLDTSTQTLARRFLYDGWNLVAELDGAGTNLMRSYTWGLDLAGSLSATGGVGALMQVYDYTAAKAYWTTYDGNGNVSSLVNASTGAFAVVYEYDPYGNYLRAEVSDTAIADQPFRFSTKYTDLETGLSYYGFRYYSSALGRFINKDPIAEMGGLNLYGFDANDGINGGDILGLDPDSDTLQLDPVIVHGGSPPSAGSSGGFGVGGTTVRSHSPASNRAGSSPPPTLQFSLYWPPRFEISDQLNLDLDALRNAKPSFLGVSDFDNSDGVGSQWRDLDLNLFQRLLRNKAPNNAILSQGHSKLYYGLIGFRQSFVDTAARLSTYGMWSPYSYDMLYGVGSVNPSGDIKFASPQQVGARLGQIAQMTLSFGLSKLIGSISAAETAPTRTLIHYTNEEGLAGILDSQELRPSLWKVGTKDVRYGNGQYLSDIAPGEMTPAQLSRAFLNQPFQGARFTNFIEIDVSDLTVIQGRPGVFVIPNEVPLDLSGRIISSGAVPVPVKF